MEKISTFITVVAAAIEDGGGRLLLQRQAPHKRHGGMWEFPGGKVDVADETPRQALAREIEEELGLRIEAAAMEPAGFAEEPADGARPALVLFLYTCGPWHGEPEAREGQAWDWFTPEEAAALAMPPMDRALLAGLAVQVGR